MAPRPEPCGWFMVPPGLASQVLHDIENIGSPDIAIATRACGADATKLRAAGYQEYPTKAGAENAANAANAQASPALESGPSLPSLEKFFSTLTQKNTWLRVGEFAFGAILVYVGVKEMFPGAVTAVTSPVKKAAKVGMLL
jgi:hypothetical protein